MPPKETGVSDTTARSAPCQDAAVSRGPEPPERPSGSKDCTGGVPAAAGHAARQKMSGPPKDGQPTAEAG
jgi:hypothetical protein